MNALEQFHTDLDLSDWDVMQEMNIQEVDFLLY